MSSTGQSRRVFNIALVGTRGIPAHYGGFETFAQELSLRLVERGHQVTVYGRSRYVDPKLESHRGVTIRVLPALGSKYLETVSHTTLSVLSALFRPFDLILVCNAANAFLCALPRLAGQRVVINVDGLERLRKKWNRLGRAYYRLGEILATRLADRVVTDARTIQSYYHRQYGVETVFIPYGALAERLGSRQALEQLGLQERRYLLYVSRLEPENNAHLVVRAYRRSGVPHPLVVVGDAPYSALYIRELHRLAQGARVLFPGAIYGRGYRELLSHCLAYVHATEVGGTHPALVEAMGAGCLVLVNDTPENREVVGQAGLLYPFNDEESLAGLLARLESRPAEWASLGERAQERVRQCYDWEKVTTQYETLFHELIDGRPK